jgi:membrane protein
MTVRRTNEASKGLVNGRRPATTAWPGRTRARSARSRTRDVCLRIWDRLETDDLFTYAAAMSFFMVFALFPAFLFLVALVGLLPAADSLDRLLSYTHQILPPDAASLVERTLVHLREASSTPLLSLSAGIALWTASSGMVSVIGALNVAYRVSEPRPWWKRRLVALALTVGLAVFMVTALVLVVFGGWLGGAIAALLGLGPLFTTAWPGLQWLIVIACVTVAISLVYRFAPARPLAWRWLGPGAAFAVLAWLATSLGLRLYVAHVAGYDATYGSIGGTILLMLWLFLSNMALLTGAHISSVIEEVARIPGGQRERPPRDERSTPGAETPRRAER